jgi:hypothetical protein
MTQSLSPSADRPSRRQQVLALVKILSKNVETIDLNEIDGEFYWRICRDDLLGPLSQLAATDAPHILQGEVQIERFSDWERRQIDHPGDLLQETSAPGEESRQRHIKQMKDRMKILQLYRASRDIVHQLPRFVWDHFATGRRIPMRAPLEVNYVDGGKSLRIEIHSQGCSGAQIASFLSPPVGYRRHFIVPWSLPPYAEISDLVEEDDPVENSISVMNYDPAIDADPTKVSIHIDFSLVNEVQLPAPIHIRAVPFISVTLSLPLPPEGVIAHMYDTIVREQHKWHLELPGSESKQEKEVALRTWAVGLLQEGGDRFMDAMGAFASATGLIEVGQTRFGQDRARLLDRVPEAKPYLYARGS